MGAKWKGRAAKGQAEWGWRTLRKPSRCSGVPCVLGPPLMATMVVCHHPQAHLLFMGAFQKGLPLEDFVSLLLSGAWLLRAASYGWFIASNWRQKEPEKAHGSHPPLPFANEETETQRAKATTYPGSQRAGDVEGGVLRSSGADRLWGTFSLLSSGFFLFIHPPHNPGKPTLEISGLLSPSRAPLFPGNHTQLSLQFTHKSSSFRLSDGNYWGWEAGIYKRQGGVLSHCSEGDRVPLGMSSLWRCLSRQGLGGGGWVGVKPEKEILYYDLFPSSLKTFSYRHANISSFSAAMRSQRQLHYLGREVQGSPARILLPLGCSPSLSRSLSPTLYI